MKLPIPKERAIEMLKDLIKDLESDRAKVISVSVENAEDNDPNKGRTVITAEFDK